MRYKRQFKDLKKLLRINSKVMNFYKLLVLQFIAYFLSDFLFQSQKCSEEKENNGFKSKYLYKHFVVTFSISAFLSFQSVFIFFSMIISSLHFLFDEMKKFVLNREHIRKYLFFFDQILHLLTVVIVVLLF